MICAVDTAALMFRSATNLHRDTGNISSTSTLSRIRNHDPRAYLPIWLNQFCFST
ncbi:MAG: hypothetical protein RIS92_2475 [Verrucomicrobiota bacterium]|jgi:hypothetical protein